MNTKQENFLTELCELFEKYNITTVYGEDGYVVFESNGNILAFKKYRVKPGNSVFNEERRFEDIYTVHNTPCYVVNYVTEKPDNSNF
jgi:hypothetical protein